MAPTAPSADDVLPIGTVLKDTYEISGVLGQGGMGTVFLAQHLRLMGRQVAIKVLRHDVGLGSEVYVRFRREAEIATRLGHPNIVEVIDFDSLDDGSPFMVMEYLRGQPLSRRLRRGPLSLAEVFTIARQMGSALQAAHKAGIVHRDLKPGNVFLVPTELGGAVVEHVKLLDFGISKVIDSKSVNTQRGILMGTPQYMAPEQATGKNPEIDPRTDIFAFGCMVYEMLARRLPFKDGPLPELVYRIVYDPPEPLHTLVPGLPRHVITAVNRALQKRPDDRFPDVGAFIAELTGSPLASYTPPTPAAGVQARIAASLPTESLPPPSKEPPPSKPDTVLERPRPPRSPDSEVATVSGRAPAPSGEEESATQLKPPVAGDAPPAPPRARRKRWAVASAAAVGAAAAAVAAVLVLRPGATARTSVAPPAQVARAETAPPPPPQPVAEPVKRAPEAEPPVVSVQQPVAPGTEEPTTGAPLARKEKAPPKAIPKAVLKDLSAAEKALARGDTAKALQLAQRSQQTHVTGTAYSLLARVHCRQKDFDSARTAWAEVPQWDRTRVRRFCKQYGLEL